MDTEDSWILIGSTRGCPIFFVCFWIIAIIFDSVEFKANVNCISIVVEDLDKRLTNIMDVIGLSKHIPTI